MKMWTIFSASRWICLLTLAVVMLISASEVDSVPTVDLPCCRNVSSVRIRRIKTCYEQKPRVGCHHHAFLITNRRNRTLCIDPAATWLTQKIERGELKCPPDLTMLNQRVPEVAVE